jgi:TonB-linked SusC/RagA family outer membrane protein
MSSFTVFGQQRLTGTVVGIDGEPIIGASVVEKGTINGTITDVNGDFSLSVSPSAVLQISYIGFVSKEIAVGGKTMLKITLEEDAKLLDEVVVVGYGVIKKADLSGSVASVNGEKLSAIQSTSLSQSLQGTMSGVQVTRSSGLPGAGATIRVRGITTISDSNPLILVDGVPGTLSMNVDDIESITVLKDAASASIYGARAASGVILVTTKRAKKGMLNIDYTGSFGFVMPTALPGTVNYKRYMEMINEISWNDGGNIPGNEYNIYSQDLINNYATYNKENPNEFPITNWKDYLIKDSAPRTKHNVSVSYGNEIIKSRATVGYEKTDALYSHRSYASLTARLNNNIKINKYLSVTVDGSYRRAISEAPIANPLRAAYLYGPLWAPLWTDGRISGGRNGTNVYAQIEYGGFSNSWSDNITGKFALEFSPIKDLTITGVYAPTIGLNKGKTFTKELPYYDADDPTQLISYIAGNLATSLEESRSETRTTTKQLLANYEVNFGKKHDFSFLMGYEDYYTFYEAVSASSNNMELSEFPYLDRGNLAYMLNSGDAYEYAYQSWFGRIGYEFANKYLFQANVRLDSSSRFHKDYRLGTFPSFSAGWIISEEPFMKKLNFKPLSFLKLRGSWGKLGNERIGNYVYQSVMSFSNALFVDGTNVVSKTTSSQRGYNIVDVTWETTNTWNIGLDAVFFDQCLSVSADYYKKKTQDMLLNLEIPSFMGYDNPDQNAGNMHTKGWDVQVEWRDKINDFRYSISANLSDYRSVMGNLSGTVFDGNTIIKEGSEYNEWYGYLSDGLFQTQEEVDNSPKLSSVVKAGDVKYKDISGPDGIPDGIINPEYDRVLLGGSLPRYIYGGNINLGYKGIDLSMAFQGVGEVNSLITSDMVYQVSAWHTFPDFVDSNYFSHNNTAEKNARVRYPRLSELGFDGNNYKMSDYWLFDGGYFRLKNVTFGYTFPKKLVEKLELSSVRVFASVSDLFSIDNYPKGWDPESSTSGNSYIASTYNFGVAIKF